MSSSAEWAFLGSNKILQKTVGDYTYQVLNCYNYYVFINTNTIQALFQEI
jgi:hypothetical protein